MKLLIPSVSSEQENYHIIIIYYHYHNYRRGCINWKSRISSGSWMTQMILFSTESRNSLPPTWRARWAKADSCDSGGCNLTSLTDCCCCCCCWKARVPWMRRPQHGVWHEWWPEVGLTTRRIQTSYSFRSRHAGVIQHSM